MGEYTIASNLDQDAALTWVAAESGLSAADYLQARNSNMLDGYLQEYQLATAPVPTLDVAAAYAQATPEQQQQVITILGLQAAT